jgi:hypothetical protein
MAKAAVQAWELREEAKQRRIEAGKRGKEGGRGHGKTLPQNSGEGFSQPRNHHDGETCAQLAKEIGVSRYKAEQSLAVLDAGPGRS